MREERYGYDYNGRNNRRDSRDRYERRLSPERRSFGERDHRDRDYQENRRFNEKSKRERSRSRSRDRPMKHSRHSGPPSRNDPRVRAVPLLPRDPALTSAPTSARASDPRVDTQLGVKYVKIHGGGRNTESFDPESTLVRPAARVIVETGHSSFLSSSPSPGLASEPQNPRLKRQLDGKMTHDDVIIVPNFFCAEDDWSIYYKLLEVPPASLSGRDPDDYHDDPIGNEGLPRIRRPEV